MRLIYLAGAYRENEANELFYNIAHGRIRQVDFSKKFKNLVPVLPHVMFLDIASSRPESYFLEATLEVMMRCDAVWVFDPNWKYSKGTVNEVDIAKSLNIPVYFLLEDLQYLEDLT